MHAAGAQFLPNRIIKTMEWMKNFEIIQVSDGKSGLTWSKMRNF
jgi:hypothetical protein